MALGHGADAQGKKGKGNLLCEFPGRLGSAFPSIHHLPKLLWRLACLGRPSGIFFAGIALSSGCFPNAAALPNVHRGSRSWKGLDGRVGARLGVDAAEGEVEGEQGKVRYGVWL